MPKRKRIFQSSNLNLKMEPLVMEPTIQEIIWAAGLFDGEGCIMISMPRKGKYIGFTPKVRIKMTHRPTVERLKELFGGGITYGHSKSYKDNWRPAWEWYIGSLAVVDRFLKLIEPYSITKHDEIKVGIEYCSVMIKQHHPRRGRPRTEEQLVFQRYCRDELQRLKTIAYYKDYGSTNL